MTDSSTIHTHRRSTMIHSNLLPLNFSSSTCWALQSLPKPITLTSNSKPVLSIYKFKSYSWQKSGWFFFLSFIRLISPWQRFSLSSITRKSYCSTADRLSPAPSPCSQDIVTYFTVGNSTHFTSGSPWPTANFYFPFYHSAWTTLLPIGKSLLNPCV